jgi:hypothetical protein
MARILAALVPRGCREMHADAEVSRLGTMSEAAPPQLIRDGIRSLLALLADANAQRDYEVRVPIADVPAELFCMWFDDQYHPDDAGFRAAFSPEELSALAQFDTQYRTIGEELKPLPGSVVDLQAKPGWTRLLRAADAAKRAIAQGSEPSDRSGRIA